MAVLDNTTTTAQVCAALDVDMVARFDHDFSRLAEVLGIFRPTVVQAGHALYKYECSAGTLQTAAAEGDEVPLVKRTVSRTPVAAVEMAPYRSLTTAQAIQEAGVENAIVKTDNDMLAGIRRNVMSTIVNSARATRVNKGSSIVYVGGISVASTLQAALAQVDAELVYSLELMGDEADGGVVHFANPYDVADYLATAQVTTQTVFGMRYLGDFLGVERLFVTGFVSRGYVHAIPAANLRVYGIDFSSLGGAGLAYKTSDSGLIGVHHEGNYQRTGVETNVMLGLNTFVEDNNFVASARIGSPLDDLTLDELKKVAKAYSYTPAATTKDNLVTELKTVGIC